LTGDTKQLKTKIMKYRYVSEKGRKANELLKEIFGFEAENQENLNDSALQELEDAVINKIVDFWYLNRTPKIFMNDDGVEIDEFLNVEEYKF
jgi:hypothetical protein